VSNTDGYIDTDGAFSPKKKREKKPHRPLPETSDSWMVSYADMMTLIACFFILMMVFAHYDAVTFQRKAELLAKYFQGENDVSEDPLASIRDELEIISSVDDHVEVRQVANGVEVLINIETLFQIGSARINPEYYLIINNIVDKIYELNRHVSIVVEGHTDDIPFRSGGGMESNWQLSGARAATVAKFFDDKGFDRNFIVAVGYADTRPAYPNRDAEGNPILLNQRRNRRIVLKIIDRPRDTRRLGLGVIMGSPETPNAE
jgi:chemotaxis protein MotB